MNLYDLVVVVAPIVATLVVTAAHARGKRLPILNILLDRVLNIDLPDPPPNATPVFPGTDDLAKKLDEILNRLSAVENKVS